MICLFAECLKALGHLEVAVKSYSKVVEMAPQHLDARLALSTLQQQLGRPNMALEALEPMYDAETLAQDSSAAQQVCACCRGVDTGLSLCMIMCVIYFSGTEAVAASLDSSAFSRTHWWLHWYCIYHAVHAPEGQNLTVLNVWWWYKFHNE